MKWKIIFLLIVMIIFSGFRNARELNELAIVSAIGIEIDEDNNYVVIAQILNTKKSSNSGSGSASSSDSSDIIVLNSTSESIQTALRNIIEESPRRLYLAHMELLLISEKLAREENILDTLNFFIRDNEGSTDFMLAITRDSTPREVLEILTPMESNPTQDIVDSILATQKYKGTATDNTLNDNIRTFLREGTSAVVTSIEIDDESKGKENNNLKEDETENKSPQEGTSDNVEKEDEKKQEDLSSSSNSSQSSDKDNSQSNEKQGELKIKVSDLAYFKKNNLSGYLTNMDSYIYNLLLNNVEISVIEIDKKDDLLVIEPIDTKTKITPKYENDKYIVDINVKLTCNITETGENVDFNSSDNIKEQEERASEYIKGKIEEFLKKMKEEYECDLIGLGNVFYKYKNMDFKTMIAKYGEDYYKNIETNVDVKVSFPNVGGIYDIW